MIFLIIFLIFFQIPVFATFNEYLTLSEVIETTDFYEPSLRMEKNEIEKMKAYVLSSQGRFDPVLQSKILNTTLSYYQNTFFDIQLGKPLAWWGSEIVLGWKKGQGKFPIYDSKFSTLSQGEWRLVWSLPLLKGRAIDDRRTRLITAEQGWQASQAGFYAKRREVIQKATYLYWNWVFSGEKIKIYQEMLDIAMNRSDGIQQKVNHGDLPQVDFLDNERAVLQRQSGVLAAKREFQKATFELSLYYRDPQGEPILAPFSSLPPKDYWSPLIELKNNIQEPRVLLESHPALKKIAFQIQQVSSELALSENQLMPKLDFQGGFFSEWGMSSPSMASVIQLAPSEVRLSFSLEIPLLFRVARGKVSASVAALEKLQAHQWLIWNQFQVQLQNAWNAMQIAQERLVLVQQEVALAQKLEALERSRADQGDSSLLLINLREQTTRDAKIKEIEVFSDFYKAKADYQAAATLDEN